MSRDRDLSRSAEDIAAEEGITVGQVLREELDEVIRTERIRQGIHERRRVAVEFLEARLDRVTDPAKRERITAAIAAFYAEEAG
jgi:hypothetical protein